MHPESEAALTKIIGMTRSDKRVVFVSGNFNIVHPGHLRLLKFAADCGDMLVVGVNSRPDTPFPIAAELRLEGVRAIGLVDYAFLLHDTPEEFIASQEHHEPNAIKQVVEWTTPSRRA